MLEYRCASRARPEVAWRLLARPELWERWAPHLRGAWRLGSPEVSLGAVGAARVFGIVPVQARITAKEAGRAWSWRVGPYSMEHRVEAAPAGCDVILAINAPAPFERIFAISYGRAIPVMLGRLAAASERASSTG